jgi:hypothetical protein
MRFLEQNLSFIYTIMCCLFMATKSQNFENIIYEVAHIIKGIHNHMIKEVDKSGNTCPICFHNIESCYRFEQGGHAFFQIMTIEPTGVAKVYQMAYSILELQMAENYFSKRKLC